jgi:hypothetical protein
MTNEQIEQQIQQHEAERDALQRAHDEMVMQFNNHAESNKARFNQLSGAIDALKALLVAAATSESETDSPPAEEQKAA